MKTMEMMNEVYTSNAIQKAIAEGFSLREVGYGSYVDREKKIREEEGCMVVSWYVPSDLEGEKKFQLYTREKKTRGNKAPAKSVPVRLFSEMTVKELRELCKQKAIKGYSKLSKDEIIAELKKVG